MRIYSVYDEDAENGRSELFFHNKKECLRYAKDVRQQYIVVYIVPDRPNRQDLVDCLNASKWALDSWYEDWDGSQVDEEYYTTMPMEQL